MTTVAETVARVRDGRIEDVVVCEVLVLVARELSEGELSVKVVRSSGKSSPSSGRGVGRAMGPGGWETSVREMELLVPRQRSRPASPGYCCEPVQWARDPEVLSEGGAAVIGVEQAASLELGDYLVDEYIQ